MGGRSGLPRGTGRNLGLGCDAGSLPGCAVAERDINDFVAWGIDALKVDGCFEFDNAHMNEAYARVGQLLRAATAKLRPHAIARRHVQTQHMIAPPCAPPPLVGTRNATIVAIATNYM